MGIISFIIIGLLAGLIARAVVPGRQSMGLVATLLLGVAGSFLGGLIGSLLSPGEPLQLRTSSLLMSILGAVVVLLIVQAGRRRRVLT